MDIKKLKHSPFCWICYEDDTKVFCVTCERSFHDHCVSITAVSENWLCPVCIQVNTTKTDGKQNYGKLLSVIVERLDIPMFNPLKLPPKISSNSDSHVNDVIVKQMDLNILKQNVDTYNNFDAFLADAKWIHHNCMALSETSEKTRTAKLLLQRLTEEIESVKKCSECYLNVVEHPNDWFTLACNEPHLLLWAKVKGYNYWPAKLMTIDGQNVNVRFFGDHTHSDLPAINCYLYSKNTPGRPRSSSNQYNAAVKEANQYIENIVKKFGSFCLANDRTVFNPTKIGEYLSDMIPGLDNFSSDTINDDVNSETAVEVEHITVNSIDIEEQTDDDNLSDDENPIGIENQSDHLSSPSSVASTLSSQMLVVELKRINTLKSNKFDEMLKQNDENVTNEQKKNESDIQIIETLVDGDGMADKTRIQELTKKSQPQKRGEMHLNESEPSEKKQRLSNINIKNVSVQTNSQLSNDTAETDSLQQRDSNNLQCNSQEKMEWEVMENATKEFNAVKDSLNGIHGNWMVKMTDLKRMLDSTIKEKERLEQTVRKLSEKNTEMMQRIKMQLSCRGCGKPSNVVFYCDDNCNQTQIQNQIKNQMEKKNRKNN